MHRAIVLASVLALTTTAAAGPPARAERVAMRPAPRPPRPYDPPPRRARVKAALERQRSKHLAALRAYRTHGVFAHALDRDGEVYVWRDADGHLDAVASMMAGDGKAQADLVVATAPQMDNVHLADLGYGDVHEWLMTSGFTADEVDKLQRPHVRPTIVRAGDTSWQADEDHRLARAYTAVESYLRSHTAEGLDAATDALVEQPELAWRLVDPKHKPPRVPPPPPPIADRQIIVDP